MMNKLKILLTECVNTLPIYSSIEMRDDTLIFDGWIHVKIDIYSAKGFNCNPDYVISTELFIPQTQDEPEDVELREDCRLSNVFSVVEKLLDIAYHNMISSALQNVGESKAFQDEQTMYAEWADEHESNGEI